MKKIFSVLTLTFTFFCATFAQEVEVKVDSTEKIVDKLDFSNLSNPDTPSPLPLTEKEAMKIKHDADSVFLQHFAEIMLREVSTDGFIYDSLPEIEITDGGYGHSSTEKNGLSFEYTVTPSWQSYKIFGHGATFFWVLDSTGFKEGYTALSSEEGQQIWFFAKSPLADTLTFVETTGGTKEGLGASLLLKTAEVFFLQLKNASAGEEEILLEEFSLKITVFITLVEPSPTEVIPGETEGMQDTAALALFAEAQKLTAFIDERANTDSAELSINAMNGTQIFSFESEEITFLKVIPTNAPIGYQVRLNNGLLVTWFEVVEGVMGGKIAVEEEEEEGPQWNIIHVEGKEPVFIQKKIDGINAKSLKEAKQKFQKLH